MGGIWLTHGQNFVLDLLAYAGRHCGGLRTLWALVGVTLALGQSLAAAADDFFQGKTVRIVVGYSPGGGYDRYARTLAQHLGSHIPGNPAVMVENMPGAGGRIVTNHIHSSAPRDGTTIGMFPTTHILMKVLGDSSLATITDEFGWLGAPNAGLFACYVMARTGVRSLDDLIDSQRTLKLGALRPGNTQTDLPRLINATLGTRFDIVTGYKGTSNVKLALVQGEVDGTCNSVDSTESAMQDLLSAEGHDRLSPLLLAAAPGAIMGAQWAGVPRLPDIIPDEANRDLFELWLASRRANKPLAVPPGTPSERLETLREALRATLSDPAFLAQAEEARLMITPTSGEEVENLVRSLLSMSPAQIESLRSILLPEN